MFKYNVINDLGVQQGKDPNYVMVTGQTQFLRGTGSQTPAMCVLYVMDANTGNFAAYGLAWNRTMARGPQVQTGTLTLLQPGKARTLEIRELNHDSRRQPNHRVAEIVNILVNGEPRNVAAGTTIAQLLETLRLDPRTLAVELNLDVIPRGRHAECLLHDGDRLEIVTLVGGG